MRVACARREEELAAVARIQAQAFYEASPIAPLDSLLYYMFQVRTSAADLTQVLHCTIPGALCKESSEPSAERLLCKKSWVQLSAPRELCRSGLRGRVEGRI